MLRTDLVARVGSKKFKVVNPWEGEERAVLSGTIN
jgi:hypothetical protein